MYLVMVHVRGSLPTPTTPGFPVSFWMPSAEIRHDGGENLANSRSDITFPPFALQHNPSDDMPVFPEFLMRRSIVGRPAKFSSRGHI
jgi:hypothetical protein